jgi:hypothetical protein
MYVFQIDLLRFGKNTQLLTQSIGNYKHKYLINMQDIWKLLTLLYQLNTSMTI